MSKTKVLTIAVIALLLTNFGILGFLIWDRGFIIYVTLDRGKLGLDVLGMDDNFRKY